MAKALTIIHVCPECIRTHQYQQQLGPFGNQYTPNPAAGAASVICLTLGTRVHLLGQVISNQHVTNIANLSLQTSFKHALTVSAVKCQADLPLLHSLLAHAAPGPSRGPQGERYPKTWCRCPRCLWPACDRLGAKQESRSLSRAHLVFLPAILIVTRSVQQ